MTIKSKALVFVKIPDGLPKAGESLRVEELTVDDENIPKDSVLVQILALSLE